MCAVKISSLNKGLVLDMKLDGNVSDSTPYGNSGQKQGFSFNNGSLISGASWGAGKFDGYNSVNLTGDPAFLNTNANTELNNQKFTYMFWLYPYVNSIQNVLMKYNPAGSGLQIQARSTGIRTIIYQDSSTYIDKTTATALQVGSWQHYALTYNGSTAIGYFNASNDAAQTKVLNVSYSSNPLHVGKSSHADTLYTSGLISNVRVWNRALSQSEIGSEMNSPVAVAGSGLVGAWEMNEGQGTIAYDTNDTVKGRFAESKAMTFDGGNNEQITTSITNDLVFGNHNFSWSAWVKSNKYSDRQCVLSNWDDWSNYAFLRFTNTNLEWSAVSGGTLIYALLYSDDNFVDGTHYMLTGTYNETGSSTIYVNGENKGSTTVNGNDVANGGNFRIANETSSANSMNGNISNVKVWNRELSALEVKQLYSQSKGGFIR